MKGIILAAGKGKRLYPITMGISKQLLNIYDKPMIYYPISVLMLAGIRDILIIANPIHIELFKKLLGDGSVFGVNFNYEVQLCSNGLSQAFIIGKKFIGTDNCALILGDNIFYGKNFDKKLKKCKKNVLGVTIFTYKVKDPKRFGIVNINKKLDIISIEEKPKHPKSKLAITGLYFYDNDVINLAREVKISNRGEFEITSLNQMYLKMKKIKIEFLKNKFIWLDAGTHKSLLKASQLIYKIENKNKNKIACLEEISYKNKWISIDTVYNQYKLLKKTEYGNYLKFFIKKNT